MIKPINEIRTGYRILVISESESDFELIQRWLKPSSFLVEYTSESLKAEAKIHENNYDLVLIDVNLEGDLNGFETIWLIKTLLDTSRILILSSNITRQMERKAASYGVYHWIQKPLDQRLTLKSIENVLNGDKSLNRNLCFLPNELIDRNLHHVGKEVNEK